MKKRLILFVLIVLFFLAAALPGAQACPGLDWKTLASYLPAEPPIPPALVPEPLIAFDAGQETQYAIVVEKKTQTLFLFSYDSELKPVWQTDCSTGEVDGPKMKSGDKKTPEGAYFLIKEFRRRYLSPIYGSRAFPTDYPNLLDRIEQKSGYAIWMHGTNKPLAPRDSNGCIVLRNKDIDHLKEFIALNRTPIIIVDELTYVNEMVQKGRRKSLLAFLEKWKESVKADTFNHWCRFYEWRFTTPLSAWPGFREKKKLFESNPSLSRHLRRISMFKHGRLFVLLFDQYAGYREDTILAGTQKLFIKAEKGSYKIVAETYQALPAYLKPLKSRDPFMAAFEVLKQKQGEEQEIACATDSTSSSPDLSLIR